MNERATIQTARGNARWLRRLVRQHGQSPLGHCKRGSQTRLFGIRERRQIHNVGRVCHTKRNLAALIWNRRDFQPKESINIHRVSLLNIGRQHNLRSRELGITKRASGRIFWMNTPDKSKSVSHFSSLEFYPFLGLVVSDDIVISDAFYSGSAHIGTDDHVFGCCDFVSHKNLTTRVLSNIRS